VIIGACIPTLLPLVMLVFGDGVLGSEPKTAEQCAFVTLETRPEENQRARGGGSLNSSGPDGTRSEENQQTRGVSLNSSGSDAVDGTAGSSATYLISGGILARTNTAEEWADEAVAELVRQQGHLDGPNRV
jgi:hypothetical protein